MPVLYAVQNDEDIGENANINFYKGNYSRPTKIIKYSKKDKINIGYFSADFRSHAVMNIMARVFELHNKEDFEGIAFSFCSLDKKDLMQKRIINS